MGSRFDCVGYCNRWICNWFRSCNTRNNAKLFCIFDIRKDKIFQEGDRVGLDTGYNGYVHKITPRVTYVRDALHESLAVIPTRSSCYFSDYQLH